MRRIRIIFALFFLGISLAAINAQRATAGADLIANPVFQKNCAKCHGKTAEGRHFGGPSLASEKAAANSVEDLSNIVANGKGRMPKYAGKLTPEEIDTLVRQIKAAKQNYE